MKTISINNTRLVLTVILTSVAILALGWTLGRTARDNVSTTIIRGQNDIISTYAYEVAELQTKLQFKTIDLDIEKGLVWRNVKQDQDSISKIIKGQSQILRELKALKAQIKKQEQNKPFLPDNAIFLPDMVLY